MLGKRGGDFLLAPFLCGDTVCAFIRASYLSTFPSLKRDKMLLR